MEPENIKDALKFSLSVTSQITAVIGFYMLINISALGGFTNWVWNVLIIFVPIFCLLIGYFLIKIYLIKRGISTKQRGVILTIMPFAVVFLFFITYLKLTERDMLLWLGFFTLILLVSVLAGRKNRSNK
jgi:hypothetical protein